MRKRAPLAKFEETEHPRDKDGKWTAGQQIAVVAGGIGGVAVAGEAGREANHHIVRPLRYAKQLQARTQAMGQLRSGKPTKVALNVFRGAPAVDRTPTTRGYQAVYFAQHPFIAAGYAGDPDSFATAKRPKGRLNRYKLGAGLRLLDTGASSPGEHHDGAVRAGKTAKAEEFVASLNGRTAAFRKNNAETRDAMLQEIERAPTTQSDLYLLHTEPHKASVDYLKRQGYHGTVGATGNLALFDTSNVKYVSAQAMDTNTHPSKANYKAANRLFSVPSFYAAPERKLAGQLARLPTARFILRGLAHLKKFDPGEARDAQGRWTGGAPSMRQPSLREASRGPLRSLTRGEGWQRIGAKLPELPAGYTGSTRRENPVDGWKQLHLTIQRPKAMSAAQHAAIFAKLRQAIAQEREGASSKGKVTRRKVTTIRDFNAFHTRTGEFNIPPGTPEDVVHRAFNYSALRALHLFGAISIDRNYQLSDSQKEEFSPLQPFIRSATGRLLQKMKELPGMKAAHQAHLKEFGQPFADGRSIGQSVLRSRRAGIPLGSTGPPRLRFSSVQQIIKRAPDLDKTETFGLQEVARRGAAWRSKAGPGVARLGEAGQGRRPFVGASSLFKRAPLALEVA